MPINPPEDTPRISPYLLYENVTAAIDWLHEAFGFVERLRIPGPDGKPTHAEMVLDDGVIMMGHPGPSYRNPSKHGHVCTLIYVYVDEVDKHYARAEAAGAKILTAPEDKYYGDRTYSAEDLEGHHWFFAQHIQDVAPEDMKP